MLRDKVIGIYCFTDDILKGIGHYDDKSRKVNDSEIITTAIVAALYFKGNQSNAINYMRDHNMSPDMINKSGFTKRLHKLQTLLLWLFEQTGRLFKYACYELEYIIDSFPLKVCYNMRISRSKLFTGKQWRGITPAKESISMVPKYNSLLQKMVFP